MEKKPQNGADTKNHLPKDAPKATKRSTNTDENIERVYEQVDELLIKDPGYIEEDDEEELRR